MRARAIFVIVAALVCAGAGWLIRDTRLKRHDAEARLAAARRAQAKLAADLDQARKTVAPRPAPASSAAVAPAPGGNAANALPRKTAPSMMDLAETSPSLLTAFVASQRALLQQRFGLLFQQLHLTAAQQEKFKDIQAAGAARLTDINSATRAQGLAFDDPVTKKLRDDAKQQGDQELAGLLGADGFRAYEEFQRTVRVRGFVDGFAVQVAATDPVNARQAEQLGRALTAASPSFQQGKEAEPRELDWTAVDRAAQEILTPAQFAEWKRGVAHNPLGGSRVAMELENVYQAARAKDASAPPKP